MTKQVFPNCRNIRAGIEFNGIGKRTAYWFCCQPYFVGCNLPFSLSVSIDSKDFVF